MTIHKKLAAIKKELSETKIPKSGHNKHLNFKYHELADFLGVITRLNAEHGINEMISVDNDLAVLTLYDSDSDGTVSVSVPFVMADMQPKNDSIQKLGATLTYLRRYLYLQAYAITEHDAIDALPLKEVKQPKVSPDNAKKLYAHVLDTFGGNKDIADKTLANFLRDQYSQKSLREFDFTLAPLNDVIEDFDLYYENQFGGQNE